MPRKVLIDKDLGSARKIPKEGDLTPHLLDKLVGLADAASDTPFSNTEKEILKKEIADLARDHATLMHALRNITIRQLRREIGNYLNRSRLSSFIKRRRNRAKKLNQPFKRPSQKVKDLIRQFMERQRPEEADLSMSALKYLIAHYGEDEDPDAAANSALAALRIDVRGRPNERSLDVVFINRMGEILANQGISVQDNQISSAVYECLRHLRGRHLSPHGFRERWLSSLLPNKLIYTGRKTR